MKRLLSLVLFISLSLLGSLSYAACSLIAGGVNPTVGAYQFRVVQGALGGVTAINRPNSSFRVTCDAAGGQINWHTNRNQEGTFQPKLDRILDDINASTRELITTVAIYYDADGNPAPPRHLMSLNYGLTTPNIIHSQTDPVTSLGPGTYSINVFASGSIIGTKNSSHSISLADVRPFFSLTGLGTLYLAIEYEEDEELPPAKHCSVSYTLGVNPSGKINLGIMSQSELDNGGEKTSDVRITTRRTMVGDGCDPSQSPTIRIAADTNLALGAGQGGHLNEAKMTNGTSVFLRNIVPDLGIDREWGLGSSSAAVAVGEFDPYTNINETIMRLVWKKTPGATVINGKAGGTIYLEATFQ